MKVKVPDFLKSWIDNDPFTQSAATAYYAVFSMPGLLIITMAVAALFFEQENVQQTVLSHIRNMLGANTAGSIDRIIQETRLGNRNLLAMTAGIGTLLFGATGVFMQLQRSLNRIWEVELKKTVGFMHFIKARAAALGIVLAIGFLLLVSLTVSTALSMLGEWLSSVFSEEWLQAISLLNLCVSFATITVLFALIFKVLPDAHVEWRYALYGGALSALMFKIGERILTGYFEIAEPQSAFGAAGSLVLLMIWVSYSCFILLLGAEFAKDITEKKTGHKVKANDLGKKKIYKS